jgi:glycosyltransferase involved in cell wall biosynthesis
MMRLALITPGFSRHGGDWAIPALQNLALDLAGSASLTVYSLRHPAYGRYQFGPILHYAGGGQQFGWRSPFIWQHTLRAIIAEHRRRSFDVVHAFWADEAGFTAVLAGKLLRRPVLVSVAGGELIYLPDIGYGTQASAFRRRIIATALAWANLVSGGSHYQLEQVRRRGIAPAKLRLAPLGVDCRRFQPGAAAGRQPVLVQAASLVPVKNQALLLDCFRLAQSQFPSLRLAVAGDGPLVQALRHRAKTLGLAPAVTWAGRLPYPAVPAFFQQGTVYLQTSRHEAQGMAVLEAMACGLPALGTPVGVLPEVATRAPNWDPAVLADQLVELLQDPVAYGTASAHAREQVLDRFQLGTAAERFLALYQELASR